VILAGLIIPWVGLSATVFAYGNAVAAMAAIAGLWRMFGSAS
jgi:hypothetical protein